jgi:hypothetical protein
VIVALTSVLLCGLPAALLLRRDDAPSHARLLGTAFLFGAGIVSLVLLAIPSRIAVLAVTVAFWIPVLRMRPHRFSVTPIRWSVADLGTLLIIGVHGFLATRARVTEWDFWAIWGLKARVFLANGGIDWAWLRDPLHEFARPDYPPLVPLNYVFIALHAGEWNDRWLGILTTLFAAAMVLIVRELFARELPRHLAALATLGAASIALSPYVGTAEAPMIAYGSAGLLLMRHGAMFPAALFLGFAACTKNEGLTLIVAAAAALIVAARARDSLRLWPALAVAAPWQILRSAHGVHGYLSLRMFDPANAAPLRRALAEIPPERPLLWLGVAVAVLVYARKADRERLLLTAAMLQLITYVGAYLLTPYPVRWHVRTSWPRITDHVAVPLLFAAVMLASSKLRERAQRDDREDAPAPPRSAGE